MKKVLIIAPLSHASPRIPGLANYLPEFGWQPIILTSPFIGENLRCRFIETEYSETLEFWRKLFAIGKSEDMRASLKERIGVNAQNSTIDRFISFGAGIINYPDEVKGWKAFAIKDGNEFLENEKVDAMISSSSPVTSHIIAKELKIKNNIPWVADLRDLWSQNHNYGYGPLRKLMDKRLELKTLAQADALSTVSSNWAEKLKKLHNGKATYTITNGYDPNNISKQKINLTSKFTITYTGMIYFKKQNPLKLFEALQGLISDRIIDQKDIEIRFFGPEMEWLSIAINRYDLCSIAKQYGVVSRQESLEKQMESQLLLLLTWGGQEKAAYSLKSFEYLAARRPILAIGLGNDLTRELLDETNSGIYAPTIEDIKSNIIELYSEYKQNGRINYCGDCEKISKYSYREIARSYVEILENIS